MRILYLVFAPQKTFSQFSTNASTGFPWVDTLIAGLKENQDLTIALAVPVKSKVFQKDESNGLALYGLPNPDPANIFQRYYRRIMHMAENNNINSYVLQAIIDFEPDIIQIFGSENPFGLIVTRQNKPVVIHIQGYLSKCLAKWFAGVSRWKQFQYANFRKVLLMRGLFHYYYVFKRRAKRETVILQNCRYFIGRTNFDKKMTLLTAPQAKYFHCEELIRPVFFERQWHDEASGKNIFISILKGVPYKGIELLLETSMILEQYSVLPFEFRICGVYKDEEIVKMLRKAYRTKCDFSKFVFLGSLNANELVTQLCAASLYIHPSHMDNSPNSVCEAMALGMPVISTDVGGIASLLNDKSEGLLIQEGNAHSLAEAIGELLKNREYAKDLGAKARLRAKDRHNPTRILNDTLNIYNEIIGDRN